MAAFQWSDEAVVEFKRLHENAGLSYSQLAGKLMQMFGGHLTRNAMIGKAHRLNLPRRGHTPARPDRRVHRKRRTARVFVPQPKPKPLPIPKIDDRDIALSQRCTLLQLTNETCRWPVGEPNKQGFFFCGAEPVEGKPYCAGHCRRAYEKNWRYARADHEGTDSN